MKQRAPSPGHPPMTPGTAPLPPPLRPTPGSPWLLVLLAVPVALLAVIGSLSLRQDRLWIEQEARDQASQLAASLTRQAQRDLEAAVTGFLRANSAADPAAQPASPRPSSSKLGAFAQPLCLVAPDGPISPPDYPEVPTPPAWMLEGSPLALSRWHAALAAVASDDLNQATALLQGLTEDSFPDLAANAQFQLWSLEADPGAERLRRLLDLAQRFPITLSPGGLPLADLALLQALRLDPRPPDLHALAQVVGQRVVLHPSAVSSDLLEALERAAPDQDSLLRDTISAWQAQLRAAGRARTLLQQLRLRGPILPGLHELALEDQPYLATVFPPVNLPNPPPPSASDSSPVLLLPVDLLRQTATSTLQQLDSARPRHFGAEIRLGPHSFPAIANEEIPADANPPARQQLTPARPPVVLASEVTSFAAGHSSFLIPFSVSVTLADPGRLFARQRQRSWLFGGLILAAVAVAGLGAWLLQRNLHRQFLLNEAKSNFVSSVSHELRAPIASVRLMAESLERERVPDPARQREYFRLIGQECRRLSALIENVLDLARIEQGRQHYEKEPVDLVALLRATVDLMGPAAADRQIILRALFPGKPAGPAGASSEPAPLSCLTVGDGKALQQALVNLIDNAVKHSPAGGHITVGLERAAPNPSTDAPPPWHLYVEDHGEGIPPEEHARIFERFYRRGSELRRETPGVGIGLSIVQHVAQAHRGRVLLRSAPGQGSRFTLELPWNES